MTISNFHLLAMSFVAFGFLLLVFHLVFARHAHNRGMGRGSSILFGTLCYATAIIVPFVIFVPTLLEELGFTVEMSHNDFIVLVVAIITYLPLAGIAHGISRSSFRKSAI